jgi:hypothetical protein
MEAMSLLKGTRQQPIQAFVVSQSSLQINKNLTAKILNNSFNIEKILNNSF